MRDYDGVISFAPRLPQAITRLAFRLCIRASRLLVEVVPEQATYTLVVGEPLEIFHHGSKLTVTEGRPLSRPIPAAPVREPPKQPQGRAPARRLSTLTTRGVNASDAASASAQ
jgi:alpha,alpha-trehalose phosphorylase